MPADVLQEIPGNAVGYFCDHVLKRDWPNSIHVYYFIKTMVKWKKNNADVKFSLLCVDNDIEDGTFIGILYSDLGGSTVLAYTQQQCCTRLERALRESRRIDWSGRLTFEAVLMPHADAVRRAAADRGLDTAIYSQSGLLYMPHELARDVESRCPPDAHVAPLRPEHVPYVHSVWAHNDIYTLRELQTTLRHNGGLAAFDADGRPLSWALHAHYGGVGVLQTREGAAGRGYARLVVAAITRALGARGVSPHVCVKDSNHRSLALFRSAGYRHVAPVQYLTVHDASSSSSDSSDSASAAP